MKILLIPRFVKEGQKNGNGKIFEPKSLNKELNKYIKKSKFGMNYIYKTGESDFKVNNTYSFYMSNPLDIIGKIIGFDSNNIQVSVEDDFLEKYKQPVAFFDVIGEKVEKSSNIYEVTNIVRVRVICLDKMEQCDIDYYNKTRGIK